MKAVCWYGTNDVRVEKVPVTITLSPLWTDMCACSAKVRQQVTLNHKVSWSTQDSLVLSKRLGVMATLKSAT